MEATIAEAMRLAVSPAAPTPNSRKISPSTRGYPGAVCAVGPVGSRYGSAKVPCTAMDLAMFSISERWVPGGRGAASTFTIRIRDETAKMSQKECRSNRSFSGKGAINIAYSGLKKECELQIAGGNGR